VFTVPLGNCGTLGGYTTGSGSNITARVAVLDEQDELEQHLELAEGLECRGLAAEPDGHFAALLWDDSADRIYVRRFELNGDAGWGTELVNASNKPTDFGIGESRLEFGDGKYGAYYHVHSDNGHEGDTLKWVDAQSGKSGLHMLCLLMPEETAFGCVRIESCDRHGLIAQAERTDCGKCQRNCADYVLRCDEVTSLP
jgi:hypothetical protein